MNEAEQKPETNQWRTGIGTLISDLVELRKHEWLTERRVYKNLGWSVQMLRQFENCELFENLHLIDDYSYYLGYRIEFRFVPTKRGIPKSRRKFG